LSAAIRVIEGQYFQDILAQPQALQDTFAWLSGSKRWSDVRKFVKGRTWRRILLTGMGSSYYSLHPLNLSLIEAGFNPVMMETSELIHYGLPLCDEETLILAVSQSGQSAEIVRLLELDQRSTVLGVTNTADSTLAERSDLALLTQAGPEFSVSCKTYVSGLLTLQWLGAIFTGQREEETLQRLEPASGMVGQYLQAWGLYTQVLVQRLRGIHHLFFVGRGASMAAVGTGALIIKESDHFHAEGMTSAAFRHGPMEMLQENMFTAVFSGDTRTRALNLRLVRELTERKMKCEVIGSESGFQPFKLQESDPLLCPILEILPVEMITLALAGLSGREAGHFEHASKVTDTE
jgi:glucosamine--fructose-6-phosphate aminotransferase (isomerizing)